MPPPPPHIIDLTHPLKSSMPVFPGDDHFSYTSKASIDPDGYNVRTMTIGSHTGTHMDAPFHFFRDGRTVDQIPLDKLVDQTVVVVDLVGARKRARKEALKKREMIRWEEVEEVLRDMGVDLNVDPMQSPTIDWDTPSPSNSPNCPTVALIHTGWSDKFWSSSSSSYFAHPFLHSSIAHNLLKSGFRIVGADTLNPDETEIDGVGGEEGYKFHETFLGAGGVILENVAHLGAFVREMEVVRGLDSDSAGARREWEKWRVSVVPLKIEGSDGSPVRLFVTSGYTVER